MPRRQIHLSRDVSALAILACLSALSCHLSALPCSPSFGHLPGRLIFLFRSLTAQRIVSPPIPGGRSYATAHTGGISSRVGVFSLPVPIPTRCFDQCPTSPRRLHRGETSAYSFACSFPLSLVGPPRAQARVLSLLSPAHGRYRVFGVHQIV